MKGRTYQRTPGRGHPWTIVYDVVEAPTGARRRVSKGGFATRKDAEAALSRALADAQAGIYAARPAQLTVGEFLEGEWLAIKASRGLRPATLAQYRSVVQHCVVPHLGAVQLTRLTPKTIQGLYDTLRASGSTQGRGGLSARSVQLTATVLRMALEHAVRHCLIPRNPAALVDRPRVAHREMAAWTNTETRQFLAATASDRLAAAWRIFLTLGPRRGEVAGLRWADVDLGAGRARFVHTLVVVDGKAAENPQDGGRTPQRPAGPGDGPCLAGAPGPTGG